MSHHEGVVRLCHMLDHAREAVAMASGKTREDLDTDRKLNVALVRLLEIIGEAASRTPADERALSELAAQHAAVRRRARRGHRAEGGFLRPPADRHDPKALIFQRLTQLRVASLSVRIIVVGAIDEDAHPGHPVALVIEIRLHGEPIDGDVLCLFGEPQSLLIVVLNDRPLERGSWIDQTQEALILLVIAWPLVRRFGIAPRQRQQEIPHNVPVEMTVVRLIGIAEQALVAGRRAALRPAVLFEPAGRIEMQQIESQAR
jgi:hypothetical protein